MKEQKTMANNDINTWFNSLSEDQKPVLEKLRQIIVKVAPEVVEEFKWGRPCYATSQGFFCYLHYTKNHVTLGFYHGNELTDPSGLLEGEGKQMRHVKLKTVKEAQSTAIKKLIQQATQLK